MSYKRCRLAANMTQQELADRIGTSKAHISQIETGSREPSVKLLVHISIVLNVCVNVLLGLPCANETSNKVKCCMVFSILSCQMVYSNIVKIMEEV